MLLVLLSGCGREIKSKDDKLPVQPLNPEELPKELKAQEVLCLINNCPGYVGKLVVYNKKIEASCAGTLISENQFIFNASCLPKNYRTTNLDCSKLFYTVFPAEGPTGKSRIIGCNKIEHVSQVTSDIASLNRDNIAIIELSSVVNRSIPTFSYEGVSANEFVNIYRLIKEDDYKSLITKDLASARLASLANPLATSPKSQNIPLVSSGNRKTMLDGGVVVNKQGRVVGLEYSSLNENFYNDLRKKGLVGKMKYYYSFLLNFACSQLSYTGQTNNCPTYKTTVELDESRANIINDESLFLEVKKSIKKYLNEVTQAKNDFIQFDLELNEDGDFEKDINVFPVCFKNYKNWINDPKFKTRNGNRFKNNFEYTFVFDKNKMIKYVDWYLNVRVRTENRTSQTFFDVSFNPRSLQNNEISDISINSSNFSAKENCKN